MNFKERINLQGQKYLVEWIETRDFSKLKEVVQSYGFIFNKKGKILLVNIKHENKKWSVPGGTVEKYDKSLKKTLIREVKEEADVEIENIVPLGYLKITPKSKNCSKKKIHYAVRYFATVKKINKQTIDPAVGTINWRKFFNTKDFMKMTKWSKNGKYQLKEAIRKFKEYKR